MKNEISETGATVKYYLGVDLGGTTVKLGLFTTEGELINKWEIPTRTANAGELILPDISESITEELNKLDIPRSQVLGAGLGVPGAVLGDSVVAPCVNLNGWGGNVAAKLSDLCGFPVKAVNDANAAALGEMWQGSGKGYNNVVFVTLGTGVGGGIIVDGRLLRGVHGAGGEIGHVTVNASEPDPCGCGKHGCLEQYASATGVVRTANRMLAESDAPSALRGYEKVTAKAVFDEAKNGDTLATEVVKFFGFILGYALASISCVCDPEVFVIGGGVSAAGQIILDVVEESFRKYAFPSAEDTAFALASLGNKAGIYGCARLMAE